MHIFYIPELTENDKEIALSEEESKHACRVLRLKKGEELLLMNGKGFHFAAKIVDDHAKKCVVKITSFTFEEASKNQIHIAICPTKNNDRMEWFVEKATEIGVTEISFVISKNSERTALKLDRFEKIAIAATKQSQRKYMPILNEPIAVVEFLKLHKNGGAIAHCYQGSKIQLKNNIQKTNYPILIGPEGDFTKTEVEAALAAKFDPISLGKNRLRTETAGLYACMMAKIILE